MELKNLNNIIYQSLEFNDFETFKAAAVKWSLDFQQLDSGSFFGVISFFDSPQIQIGTTNFNRKLDQRGITPPGYRTFIIPKRNFGERYIWRGHEVSENEMLIQPKTGEFSSITDPGWGIYTVSISEEIALKLFEKVEHGNSNSLTTSKEVIQLSSQAINRLRKQLDFIFNLAKADPSTTQKKVFRQIFLEEIPSMILNNLVAYKYSVSAPPSRIRDIAFRKAIDYIKSCTTEMPTVRELCLISGSSERTLQNAFKEKYGFGPKEHIRKQLLNRVRHELLHSNSSVTKVQDVAHRYGLIHHGHFSADYKKLFGELPSETLGRRR